METSTSVWADAQQGCERARDEIVRRYGPLVNYVANQLRNTASIPLWVEQDDLISYGNIGLMNAMQRFEPERGLQFTTYAVRRIKGAILDELRRLDWAPRQLRPDARALAQCSQELSHKLGREPTKEELVSCLGWTHKRVDAVLDSLHDTRLLSLDSDTFDSDDDDDSHAPLSVPGYNSIGEEAMAETEYISRISQALDLMEPHERSVMALYYFEEMRFIDIAEMLGVSESWVGMIHGQAMTNMRSLATM